MSKKMKWTFRILTVVILLLVVAGLVDYGRVRSFEKPLFASAAITADDGGSGTYRGIGYSIEIKGNFMPEDEFPGVTQYEYFLFGNSVVKAVRD